MSKKISVIMGIYNCAETLQEALDCILNQSYTNWEVIMCDDCSADNTVDVAEKYVIKYPYRFVLLKNRENRGLNYTLNKCLKYATGNYIARMDGDDLCDKDRFMKEVEVLENNSDIAIVSTDMEFFDENGIWGRTHTEKLPLKADFLRATPFCHAACMVHRSAYMDVKGYSVSNRLLRVEDYHLWIKMYEKGYKGMNIQECLYSMRDDRNAQGRRKFKYRLNEAYVKGYAIKKLGLKKINYVYCLIPVIKGLLPSCAYRILHRTKSGKC
ncbi:glycosyltransferase family 2 protein [Faecalimonas sp.]